MAYHFDDFAKHIELFTDTDGNIRIGVMYDIDGLDGYVITYQDLIAATQDQPVTIDCLPVPASHRNN